MTKDRKIVANLAWRYLLARRLTKRYEADFTRDNLYYESVAREIEAWNAYGSARRILNGTPL